ncbi:unnamed protein product [Durusdinium trenchii]|uniref:Uncharacterized protein n=1 Tax=Durusdinium trenchii TaxID=1381693 RepID=A0ABP0K3S2_9DINO
MPDGKLEQWLTEVSPVKLQKVFKLPTWSYAFVTVLPEHKEQFREAINGLQCRNFSITVKDGTPRKAPQEGGLEPSAKRQKIKDFPPGHVPTLKDVKDKLKNKKFGDILHKTSPLIDWSYETQLGMKQVHIKSAVRAFTKQVAQKCRDLNQPPPDWTSHEWSKGSKAPVGCACPLDAAIGTPNESLEGYRNKCEFSIGFDSSGQVECGMVLRITDDGFGRVVASCDEVPFVPQEMKRLCKALRDCARSSKFPVFERGRGWQRGFWRLVMARFSGTELLVMVQTATVSGEEKEELVSEIKDQVSLPVVSVYLQFNDEVSDAARPGAVLELIYGQPQLRMQLLGLSFDIGPLSFYQANSATCALLYGRALEWLQPEEEVTVLDVCCGVGTIGLCASRRCRKVIGIELVPEAVESAKANAALNQIENTEWMVGKAEDILPKLLQELDPNMRTSAVVDPPRPGLHSTVLRALRSCSQLSRIVYVSCNPDSLVEDVIKLTMPSENDEDPFIPVRAVAVDMFPHTLHCEMILLLERSSKVKDPRKHIAPAEGASGNEETCEA